MSTSGQLELSSSCKKVVETTSELDGAEVVSTNKFKEEVCSNQSCPRLVQFYEKVAHKILETDELNGDKFNPEELPSLKLCKCKLVRYCGKDCQAKDWPNHKARCKASLPKTAGK